MLRKNYVEILSKTPSDTVKTSRHPQRLRKCGSIYLAGTCQILSSAENPRWSRVWQLRSAKKSYLDKWHLWTNLT